jgi:hypothetical protein
MGASSDNAAGNQRGRLETLREANLAMPAGLRMETTKPQMRGVSFSFCNWYSHW